MARALYRRGRRRARSADAAQQRRLGGSAARGRLHRLAHRLPQARRLHPAERRHAGVLRRRAVAPRRCSCWAAAAASTRCRPRSRIADTRAQVLALRLAVLFHHARRPIDAAAHRARGRQGDPLRHAEALARRASADRAPARARSRRSGRRPGYPIRRRGRVRPVRRTRDRSRPSARPRRRPSGRGWTSHHTAPFFTDQYASSPDSRNDATAPSVGWCPTISTGSRDSGQFAAASTAATDAPGARSSTVRNLRPSAAPSAARGRPATRGCGTCPAGGARATRPCARPASRPWA